MSEMPLSEILLAMCEHMGIEADEASIRALDSVVLVQFKPALEPDPEYVVRSLVSCWQGWWPA